MRSKDRLWKILGVIFFSKLLIELDFLLFSNAVYVPNIFHGSVHSFTVKFDSKSTFYIKIAATKSTGFCVIF